MPNQPFFRAVGFYWTLRRGSKASPKSAFAFRHHRLLGCPKVDGEIRRAAGRLADHPQLPTGRCAALAFLFAWILCATVCHLVYACGRVNIQLTCADTHGQIRAIPRAILEHLKLKLRTVTGAAYNLLQKLPIWA